MALPVLRRNRTGDERAVQRAANGETRPLAQRWSPWAELAELHDRMGRLLTEAFGPGWGAGVGGAGSADVWRPAADVEETDEAYLVELELPGAKREDVSVEFGAGELAVTGEIKQRERVGLLRTRTRPVGRFDYRVHLPADVQDDQVSASLADGVLTVRVPKTEKARRRRIAINSS